MKIQPSKQAFSLIELAVVLIIIGILAAGILSGRRLIDQSKLKSAQALTKSAPIYSMPDLALWLETTLDNSVTGAINGNNLSDGEAISSWNDIGPSQINISQSSATNQPTYLSSGINSLPSLSFDGASDILYSTTAPINNGSGIYTMIMVWRSLAISASPVAIAQNSTNNATNKAAGFWLNSNSFKFTGKGNDTNSIGAIAANSNYIGILVVNNNDSLNVSGYLNSNSKVQLSTTSVSALNLSADFFSVGGQVSSVGSYINFTNALISEVIIFNRNLNPYEVALINKYLAKKYNITLS